MALLYFDDQQPGRRADYAVVMPVHNREQSLNRTLGSLINTMAGSWELAVIVDDCTDASARVVVQMLTLAKARGGATNDCRTGSMLIRAIVYRSLQPLFETASDNLGMHLTDPLLAWILVQSDVIFAERGWNHVLAAALNNVTVAVSARCYIQGSRQRSHNLYCAGNRRRPRRSLSVKEQAMANWGLVPRGPLLLRASAVRALGFLDEGCFYMGSDEFNLQKLGYERFGWLSAYVYADLYQDPLLHQWKHRGDPLQRDQSAPNQRWRSEGLFEVPHRNSRAGCGVSEKARPSREEKTRGAYQIDLRWLRAAFAHGACGMAVAAGNSIGAYAQDHGRDLISPRPVPAWVNGLARDIVN